MSEIIPLAFEENLVRAVEYQGEAWFVGNDVCGCLGLKNPRSSLDLLDEDEKGVHTVDALCGSGGRQAVTVISEPGVYRLVFRSRKPEAERFKRWLAHDVLPQLRKTGRYGADRAGVSSDRHPDPAAEGLAHRLHLVREARILFGRERARSLWSVLGLPAVPPPPAGPLDEARICLRQLLDAPVHAGGARIRDLLELALDDDDEARVLLKSAGIRPDIGGDGFLVANRSARLNEIFDGTEWTGGRHMRVLRRLPGTAPSSAQRFEAGPIRATFVAAELLDEWG